MAVILDHIASAATAVSSAYAAAHIPQPLLRPKTMRVPRQAIGAGIEAASIGARTGTSFRRTDAPGLDLDITADYSVCNALAGAQRFLTHEVTARRIASTARLASPMRTAEELVAMDLLTHPARWPALAFLVKPRFAGEAMTAHVELFGHEATVTAPIVSGSRGLWMTGYDLVAAAIEDLDRGGSSQIPEIEEAWTFDFGPRLPGLGPVAFPGGWTWDPRRRDTYRSRDGRTWGHFPLLLAAMRLEVKEDPSLSLAQRLRRAGMLKVAANAAAFGLFSATTPITAKPGTKHRVITSEGTLTLEEGTPERPGAWSFPPAAALVEGAGRLLLTLLLHEVRIRGGSFVQFDTDGGFILATPKGGDVP